MIPNGAIMGVGPISYYPLPTIFCFGENVADACGIAALCQYWKFRLFLRVERRLHGASIMSSKEHKATDIAVVLIKRRYFNTQEYQLCPGQQNHNDRIKSPARFYLWWVPCVYNGTFTKTW